ncbi:MAG: type II secretion system protein [Limisphaerales bacterium]
MKPRSSHRTNHALTLVEVLVIVAVLAILAAILLLALAITRKKTSRIGCVNNLKQIGLAYRVWSGDNSDKYPMGISVTNGGSMEMVATGNVTQTFLVMSNELSTAKILHCPQDAKHIVADSFDGLTSSNISYFVAVDVTNSVDPQAILSGDDNFQVSGLPVKSGLLELWSSPPISWTSARHKFAGYILVNDGSVQQLTQNGLRQAFQQSSTATNRLAIP